AAVRVGRSRRCAYDIRHVRAGAAVIPARQRRSWPQRSYVVDEIRRVAEARARHAALLFVVERDLLALGALDALHDGLFADSEAEDLRRRARDRGHRQLALPRSTDPSLVRELLHVPDAI